MWRAALGTLAFGVLAPTAARAGPPAEGGCARYLWFHGGKDCPPTVESSGREQNIPDFFRAFRERGKRKPGREPLGPIVPGPGGNGASFMPSPLSPTKEGPMGMDDLHLVPNGQGGYNGSRPGYKFDIERDGTIHFNDRPPIRISSIGLLGIAAIFDLTDLVMRAAGMDPYGYDKGRVAELTRAMREEMSAVERPAPDRPRIGAPPRRARGALAPHRSRCRRAPGDPLPALGRPPRG